MAVEFGDESLSQLLARLERAARTGDEESLQDARQRIVAAFRRLMEEIDFLHRLLSAKENQRQLH